METYPASLPCPQSLTHTPTPRALSATSDRPRDSRALQIDESAIEQITWPPLNAEQYTALRNWWSTNLVYGGAVFVATWPGPRGEIPLARKFIEQPRWNFIGGPDGGYWQPSAVCEMRGRYYEAVAVVDSYMLLESGDFVLLEDGSYIVLE